MIASTLRTTLETSVKKIDDAEIARLMRRTHDLHALDPRHCVPKIPPQLRASNGGLHVLVIDERIVPGRSRRAGRACRSAFRAMLNTVRHTHPGATVWLGRSNGAVRGSWLSEQEAKWLPTGIERLDATHSLCATITAVDHVYTVAALEGLHALLAGVPLHVFGGPYYAGWGLTHDSSSFPDRTVRPTLAQFFAAVFMHCTDYIDPLTHTHGTLNSLLDSIALQRDVAHRYQTITEPIGVQFQRWKRPFATPFLESGGGAVRWDNSSMSIAPHEQAVFWGARSAQGLMGGVTQVRIEDGFLHSWGLGSDMHAPRSQIVDLRGLYFDPMQPSDLTVILNETDFGDAELRRAAALRAQIVELGLTKYNLGRRAPNWRAPAHRRIVLVPGQVADDASIRLGTRGITTAEALLQAVRVARPDAWIVYKPHPDVLSGNRRGMIDAARFADVVDMHADLISLIDAADEVHTLSSLSGFEALLRTKKVCTYGLPFYAGWGLTEDALAQPWRQRALTLDMLVAGALLHYPLYWDWTLKLFTTPERIVRELAPRAGRTLIPVRNGTARSIGKAARWTRNVLMHLASQIMHR